MQNEAILRVEEAIKAIKNGEMIIVMDDEDRENEGDLVMAGIFSTPEKINFMAQEARGLICVSITKELSLTLDLPPMVSKNSSNHETAFTVSIDAKEAKTGISAYERDLTINLMCKPNTKPEDFVRPGHIFPLIAKEGGVLERTGHTEASVDICKLAGLKPISVICEIMKEDGMMAHRGDKFLIDFSKKHHLKILYVSDLVQYRLQFEQLIKIVGTKEAEFCGKKTQKIEIQDHLNRIHRVFKFKDSKEPLVKFHHIKEDVDFMENGAEFNALIKAVEKMSQEGGYLVCMQTHKQKDIKGVGIGAQILKSLQVQNFRLLSTSEVEQQSLMLGGFNLKMIDKIELD
ncbi:bifunctional 3,4-dihydroxy-2-butanone 4-phosphate synthase/GTP cyclohydrolase II [Helicobacter valdiviensis]|uniref:3,4-dihydroxy-2-butanone 4-phosphate synthase n=1 Tax=Helicobacter valdiviensis TaxID=1458358 RepID=A0A2W6MUE9_9HELI|nr:bifunctional 3,4-dihydroxy-2-butanone 4-phosphate synthase/GTP cyclohydrolase II [Helicobacter valdiviensis]PZT47539.1 bifunctional 3,4-dihydroxy-2-butanone 4-phosphate synthase/GTP cyclohydrolase II [Helicobacter valdiviensis]